MKYLLIFLILLLHHFSCSAQSVPIRICGNADFLKDGDTITLSTYKHGLVYAVPPFQTDNITRSKNHKFRFSLPSGLNPYYVSIDFKHNGQHNLMNYIVEASDNIRLNFKNDNVFITGSKSKGFDIQYKIRKFEDSFMKNGHMPHFSQLNPNGLSRNFEVTDSLANVKHSMLRRYKNYISRQLYNFISTDIFADGAWSEYYTLNYLGAEFRDSLNNPIMSSYHNYLITHQPPHLNVNPMSKYCGVYIDYLIDKYKVDSCLDKNRRFQVTECIKFFSKTYSGTLKEQLIACIIAETKQYPQELRKIIDYELLSMKNPDYRRFLKNVEDTRIDGATAYNFRLKDTQGRKVQLNDFKGKVVILDFWFTGCINCEELAPYMKNIEMQFSDMPVVFVSISIDKIKEQWLKSIISGTYSSPEIVNLCTNDDNIRKEVLQNYHIDSYPTLVIINKKGNVVNVHIDPRNDNGISLQKQISDCLN